MKFRLVRQSRADVDVSQAAPSLEIIGPDGKALPPDQTPTPAAGSGQPDVFTAEFTAVAGGRYQVNTALTADGKPLANQTAEFFGEGPDSELADRRTNIGNLKALAKGRPDTVFTTDQADELAKKITPRTAWGRNTATSSGTRRSCSRRSWRACWRSGSCGGGIRWCDRHRFGTLR